MSAIRDRRGRFTLRAAAVYNLAWGAVSIVAPGPLLSIVGLPEAGPVAIALWQCLGMVIGLYGLGYWLASRDPSRHWPIVLIGLLGKVLGPAGFVFTAARGDLPWSFGWMILTNDLIWWVPFTIILFRAADEAIRAGTPVGAVLTPRDAMARAVIAGGPGHGLTLLDYSSAQPVLVVFLRHAGCTFCREALADLAKFRTSIERDGKRIVLVHMGQDDRSGLSLVEPYGLQDAGRVADPDRGLYRAFELPRGTLAQLFGWSVFLRGISAGLLARHGVGPLQGDGFQMPGVFVVRDGRIVRGRALATAAERPDYCELARGPA